ncbi:metallophosphoesterase [Bittarella massiliensis (ex Durand et al. 2017)]|uniref:metallophosphoesterase n=1 Tax=Bittarella massiliensis (ex Durand et al. 2017) TaxID=1720313 RepID=UPI00073EE4F8|nr:metallophosphoesterase [Bittarella massiliensis (ex Durand et al. 2017)]
MSIFALGDTHLSLASDKPMDVFPGWSGYLPKLEKNWRDTVADGDTVVIPGDVSWAMSLEEAATDFAFLDSLPGRKILLKGNHDYWWSTKNKMDGFLAERGFTTLSILSNESYQVEGVNICGSRSWFFEDTDPHDAKIRARELGRIRMSLEKADPALPILLFLHYPPVYRDFLSQETIDLMGEWGITQCYYGHLHGKAIQWAFEGDYEGIAFRLVSADALNFCPLCIRE